MPTLRSLLLAGAALLAAPAARTQTSPELTMELYTSNIQVLTSGLINKSMLDAAMARNSGRAGGGAVTGRSPATRPAYVPTATLRQQAVQAYVNRLKASNSAGTQAVASVFGPSKHDYGQVYHGIMKASGLPENDAADVLTSYLLLGCMIVNTVQDGNAITVPTARGMRAQVAPLLAANAQARSHAAQVGEELKLQTVVVQGDWQSASKEGKLAAYQQGLGNLFKT